MMDHLCQFSNYSQLEDELEVYQYPNKHVRLNKDILAGSTVAVAPIGLVLNIMLLYAVVRIKSFRSLIAYMYLTNLALADSAFLTIALSSLPWWQLDDSVQTVLRSISISCRLASYCFVTALAFDRYFAVRSPIKFRLLHATKSRSAKISVASWTVAVGAGAAHYMLYRFHILDAVAHAAIKATIHAAVLSTNIYLYVCILRTLGIRPQHSLPCKLLKSRVQGSRVLRIVILNTTIFFVFNALALVPNVWILKINASAGGSLTDSSEVCVRMHYLQTCVSLLYIICCSVDPIIYSAAIADRRAAFVEAFSSLNFTRCCRSSTYYMYRPTSQAQTRHIEMGVLGQKPSDERPVNSDKNSNKRAWEYRSRHTEETISAGHPSTTRVPSGCDSVPSLAGDGLVTVSGHVANTKGDQRKEAVCQLSHPYP